MLNKILWSVFNAFLQTVGVAILLLQCNLVISFLFLVFAINCGLGFIWNNTINDIIIVFLHFPILHHTHFHFIYTKPNLKHYDVHNLTPKIKTTRCRLNTNACFDARNEIISQIIIQNKTSWFLSGEQQLQHLDHLLCMLNCSCENISWHWTLQRT